MLPRLRSSCQIALISLSSWRGPALGVIGASWGLITLSVGGPLWSTVLAWGLAVCGAGSVVTDLRTVRPRGYTSTTIARGRPWRFSHPICTPSSPIIARGMADVTCPIQH